MKNGEELKDFLNLIQLLFFSWLNLLMTYFFCVKTKID